MTDKGMTCPDCNSPNYIKYIDLIVSCPANVDEVTKSVINKKEVNIVGIDWENVRYFCPDCFDRMAGLT
jgi:hypothetical protein